MSGTNSLKFDFVGADRSVGKTMEAIADRGDRLGKRLGGLARGFSTVGKVAGLALGGAAVGGIAAVSGALVQGVKDAASYQTLARKTAAVLKSTGNAAGTSVKGIQGLAGSLESLSGVDEELIINAQNVLATFTGVKNLGKNKIFDEATKSALDMSVALGTDLQGATLQVGKALNDPIKGVSALSRVGVSFTDQQKAQIKTLVESGKTMDAQKIILAELNKEFGGAAKAAGSGFEGSVARLKDALGDAGREIGTALLPSLTKAADWLGEKIPKAIAWAKDAWFALSTAFSTKDPMGAWTDGFLKIQKVGYVARVAFDGVSTAVGKLVGWFKGDLMPALRSTADKVMPLVRFGLDQIGKAFGGVGGKGDKLGAVLHGLGVVITKVMQAGIVVVGAFAVSFGIQMRAASLVIDKVLIPAIKGIWWVFKTQVGLILGGAAKAFGWIPGIGPKLTKAADDFEAFAQSVEDSLNGIKPRPVWVDVKVRSPKGVNIRADYGKKIGAGGYASGGYPAAGQTAWVGEKGPELVTFGRGAHVLSTARSAALLRSPEQRAAEHGPVAGMRGAGGAWTGFRDVNVYITDSVIASRRHAEDLVVRALRDAQSSARLRVKVV